MIRSLFVENIHQFINNSTIRFIDHSKAQTILQESNNGLASFAIDDAIATAVGNKVAPVTVRIWVHQQTLILGIPDSRLPYLTEGLDYIKDQGYHAIIRNSGGLAVLLDKDVLNMSLILPSNNKLSIYDGYDLMVDFIQELFNKETNEIKAFEIKGSYCPGDYDLSIDGIKFAGISQRRVRNGVAVQIYVDIAGSSAQRASIVRDFYQISKKEEQTKYHYPEIDPNVMGSINELLHEDFTVDQIIHRIKQLLLKKENLLVAPNLLSIEEEVFEKRIQQMQKRNEIIKMYNPR